VRSDLIRNNNMLISFAYDLHNVFVSLSIRVHEFLILGLMFASLVNHFTNDDYDDDAGG
jgi:hypothetical protein